MENEPDLPLASEVRTCKVCADNPAENNRSSAIFISGLLYRTAPAKYRAGLLAGAFLLISFGSPACAASLNFSTLSLPAGGTGITSLAYASGGDAATGIEFDVQWDPAISVHITQGAQLGPSGKLVYATPLGPTQMRIVIAGLNQSPLADGEVLRLFAFPNATDAPGTLSIVANNTAAVNANGDAVSLAPAATDVQIQPGSPSLLTQSLVNAADFLAGPVSPGEIVTFLGQLGSPLDPNSPPVLLFNGVPAPVIYAGGFQINAVVPFGLDTSGPAQVELQNAGQSVSKWVVPTAGASPSIFVQAGTGLGPGAILNQDLTLNTYSNPANRGSTIMVYGTGFGTLSPAVPDGQTSPGPASTDSPVTATIDGVPATVLYSGAAPSLIAGVTQINIQVPSSVRANTVAALQLSIGGVSTPPGISVAIQ